MEFIRGRLNFKTVYESQKKILKKEIVFKRKMVSCFLEMISVGRFKVPFSKAEKPSHRIKSIKL